MSDYMRSPPTELVDLANEAEFELGLMTVTPAECIVVFESERHELQPRVMQVLVALARARPNVVSRNKLIEQCWDGRIVGDDALNRCILSLRHLAQKVSPAPFAIETVPRVGYRLIETPDHPPKIAKQPGSRPRMAFAVALAILVSISGGWFAWQQRNTGPEVVSIAVLPFRNLSSGDSYFAEGIGEEILAQMAGDPGFQVSGRASSAQLSGDPDPREASRALGVDYLLQGSVRRQGGRVRVNAHLVRGSDGARLWADSYDGHLDDIFRIQRDVGVAIAGAMRRKLTNAPPLSGPLVTSGEVYKLYLTARGLIRTRQRSLGATAVGFLQEAIRIDPNYAPAWASLAEATQMSGATGDHDAFAAAVAKAEGYARHAVELAPDSAEAHRALGENLPYGTPESQAHLRRAADIDPNSAENLVAFGEALSATGEFDRQLEIYRRAIEIDRLWYRTIGATALTLAERGHRSQSEALARRAFRDNVAQLNIVLGRIAWIFGDFSKAFQHWSVVVRTGSPRWAATARRTMDEAAYAVGLNTGRLVDVPSPIWTRYGWRVWTNTAPSPSAWRSRNRDAIASAVYRSHNHVAAKLMLNSGRIAELAATYRSRTGLLGLRPGRRPRVDQIETVPIVALALRQSGATAEADRLERDANSLIRQVYRKNRVPFWFDADVAAVYSVQGRNDDALDKLEQALDRGWTHSGASDLREISDEPAFQSLHDLPRFKRIQSRLVNHYARERRELEQLIS